MTSLIYNTGTVAITNGSATVTGSGTGWAVALVTGGLFSCAGMSIPIASVESDTSLTLAYPWPGVDATGAAYAIARDTSEAVRAAWTNDRLATIIQKLALVGIHPDGSGTLTERDALDPVPSAGYLWLYAESGHDLAFYRKTASGWDGPFDVRGGTGGPGAAATIAVGSVTSVAPGDPATVTNSGSSGAAVFDFEIPKGDPGAGNVNGPASSVDGYAALFDGTTGKLLKATSAIQVSATGGRVGIGGAPSGSLPLRVVASDATIGLTATSNTAWAGVNIYDYNGANAFSFQYGNTSATAFTNEMAFATRQSTIPLKFYQGGVASGNERLRIDASAQIALLNANVGIGTASPSTKLHVTGPVRIGSYTVATLPSASATGAGAIAYASDASGGAIPVFSDGTNWRKFSDRSIVA